MVGSSSPMGTPRMGVGQTTDSVGELIESASDVPRGASQVDRSTVQALAAPNDGDRPLWRLVGAAVDEQPRTQSHGGRGGQQLVVVVSPGGRAAGELVLHVGDERRLGVTLEH